MKKCPSCNRTYSDETLSFCLADGSLLSAPYNLHEEQETVFRPTKTNPAPTEYFPAITEQYQERATVLSPINTNLNSNHSPKKQINVHLIILCVIWGNLFLVVAYTGSIIPLILALAITLFYLIVWQVIKFFK